jgi:Spy/CpxP family protein refolding chaperone
MKKILVAPSLLAIALSIASIEASAQIRPNRGIRGTNGPAQIDAQIRRNKGVLGGQRGVNRPPFGIPPAGRNRPVNPNQIRKQQMQQRLMQAIGLTPDQRSRMQEIRRSHDDDVIAAGRRLRQARQAVDRAIMSEPYSEPEVRRAIDSLAAAQAEKVRIDATVRAQVRGVLTPDQVRLFHQLQRQMNREMKEQQQKDQEREQGRQGMRNNPEPQEIDLAELLLAISSR